MREMKDSGIDYIGYIPKTWTLTKIKFCAEIFGRIGFRGYTEQDLVDYEEDGAITLSPSNFHDMKMDYKKCTYLSWRKYEESPEIMINNGDVLLVKTGSTYGKAVYVTDLPKEATINPQLIVFKNIKTDSKLFSYILQTKMIKIQTELAVVGGTIPTMSQEKIYNFILPEIPESEQQKILIFIDKECDELDCLISDIQSQIEVLEEYKRSVITEAVTKGLDPDVEMKDSGVQWIGMMPTHWDCQRGKYILRYVQKPVKDDDGVITCFRDGEVTLRSNRREEGFTMADKEIGYQGIDVGDLVVHGMDQNKRYIMYYLRSMAYNDVFVALATGIRVRSCDLRWNKLAELLYPMPPVEEQQVIVEHIDSVLERTNAIIADKKQQIETIEEYKKSLIFEYVTGKKEISDSLQTVTIQPVLLLAMILREFGNDLRGKIHAQKAVYLCEMVLGSRPNAQYFRYEQGPYDEDLDSYLKIIHTKQWFIIHNGNPMTCTIGEKYGEFEEEYKDIILKYSPEIKKIVDFIRPMRSSQAGRIATLYAVWNDMIIDGITNPSDTQIIDEVTTNWTVNKRNPDRLTWQDTLNKMKDAGIVPTGKGLHTKAKTRLK